MGCQMAWICVGLDGVLLSEAPEELGGGLSPIPGAVEAVTSYVNEGNRVTVFTSRFAPMPDSEKQRLRTQIEQDLASLGFPQLEVWTGTTKPDADFFIDDKAVTFDGDWGLVQAQVAYAMQERGLQPMAEPPQEEA